MFRHQAGRAVKCPRCRSLVIVPEEEGELAVEVVLRMRTARLELRPAVVRDWRGLIPIYGHPPNFEHEILDVQTPRSLRKWLRGQKFPKGLRDGRGCCLLARRRSDGELIGTVHVVLDPDYLTGRIGFMIHQDHRRLGYGTEAVGGVVGFCFRELNLMTVAASCDARNEACLRLLEAAGFEREGFLRRWWRHPARGWIDSSYHAIHHPARDD